MNIHTYKVELKGIVATSETFYTLKEANKFIQAYAEIYKGKKFTYSLVRLTATTKLLREGDQDYLTGHQVQPTNKVYLRKLISKSA